ncbi:MAG: hypothetical protein VYD19_09075 [Myxococcota bacterium]|nr:hypothetical protein [Myxococcota bacterium]
MPKRRDAGFFKREALIKERPKKAAGRREIRVELEPSQETGSLRICQLRAH